MKFPQDVRQHGRHREPRESHPDAPDFAAGNRFEFGRHRSERAEERLNSFGQRPSRSRQFDAPARAEQEAHPKLGLELKDLPAERRLGDHQRLGRAPKMEAPGHFAKID